MTESLSVVMPAYNEEATIAAVIGELDREVASRFDDAEIIVVDDASTDATGRILDGLATDHPRLTVVHRERNAGHGPAVMAGFARARGTWVLQMDSDGQFDARDFWALWARRDGADLVLGIRRRRRDPLHRLALSRVVAATVSALAGRRISDPNVPFRLLRRALAEDLRPFLPDEPLAPSILMTTGAVVRGARVVEVPVSHRGRPHGRSTLRAWRLIRFALRGLGELVSFRLTLRRARPSPGSA